MASCKNCGRDVGCGCNLVDGLCVTCLAEHPQNQTSAPFKQSTKRVVYQQPVYSPEPSEFDLILNEPGLSKEEKLARINTIIDKANSNLK